MLLLFTFLPLQPDLDSRDVKLHMCELAEGSSAECTGKPHLQICVMESGPLRSDLVKDLKMVTMNPVTSVLTRQVGSTRRDGHVTTETETRAMQGALEPPGAGGGRKNPPQMTHRGSSALTYLDLRLQPPEHERTRF